MFLDFATEEIAIIFYIIIPGILSYILVPLIKILAHKFLILHKPNFRKIHTKPIPNVGGISIFISFFYKYIFFETFCRYRF